MKNIGIYAGMGYPVPIEQRISMIRDVGFDMIALNFEDDMRSTETSWENQVKLAEKYALPPVEAHLTGTMMTSIWSDCDAAEFVTGRLINELKHLREVGVPVGIAHITWGHDVPPEPSLSALHRFERITEAAEKYGVRLALENSVFAKHVHFVLEHIQSEYLGFCYDSGHENAFTPTETYLQTYGDRLYAMHLHDNNGKEDNHFVPFDPRGTIDWESKMTLLNRTKLGSERIVLELGAQKESLEAVLASAYEAGLKLAKM